MTLTPEQIALRRTGITATDAAAILGVHPHRRPIDVWLDKRGESACEESPRMRWGTLLEPVVLQDWCHRHEAWAVPGSSLGTWVGDGDQAWMVATPDAVVVVDRSPGAVRAGPARLLEIKTHSAYARAGADYGTEDGDLPAYVEAQVRWQMAAAVVAPSPLPAASLTGDLSLDVAHVCALIDGLPVDVTIERDAAIEDEMRRRCKEWYERHHPLAGGEAPDPDGSEAYDGWLRGRPATQPPRPATAGERELVTEIRRLSAAATSLEQRIALARQRLALSIGEAHGIQIGVRANGKPEIVHYGPRKGSPAWKAIAEQLAEVVWATPADHLPAVIEAHRAPTTRVLRVGGTREAP